MNGIIVGNPGPNPGSVGPNVGKNIAPVVGKMGNGSNVPSNIPSVRKPEVNIGNGGAVVNSGIDKSSLEV